MSFITHYLKNQKHWEKDNKIEKNADEFAANTLIDNKSYKEFIIKKDFSMEAIKYLAKTNNVLPAIVIGRLMNDQYIPWSAYQRETYAWVEGE